MSTFIKNVTCPDGKYSAKTLCCRNVFTPASSFDCGTLWHPPSALLISSSVRDFVGGVRPSPCQSISFQSDVNSLSLSCCPYFSAAVHSSTAVGVITALRTAYPSLKKLARSNCATTADMSNISLRFASNWFQSWPDHCTGDSALARKAGRVACASSRVGRCRNLANVGFDTSARSGFCVISGTWSCGSFAFIAHLSSFEFATLFFISDIRCERDSIRSLSLAKSNRNVVLSGWYHKLAGNAIRNRVFSAKLGFSRIATGATYL